MIGLIRRALDLCERRLFGMARYYRRRGAKIGMTPVFSSPLIGEPHLTVIGDNVWITAGCRFINHDGAIAMLYRAGKTDAVNVVGRIIIHDNVFVGSGSTIMGDVEIGPNAVVASGSVVTRDVPEGTVVGGCPAKPIGTVQDYLAKYEGEETTLWAESDEAIRDTVIRHFMTEGHRGKRAIRLRHGKSRLTA
jgi:carbonic anhydrase/acetyltransferase-like protein (isoleucine patch superfamily)